MSWWNRLRVPTLAALAIGVSSLAVWVGTRPAAERSAEAEAPAEVEEIAPEVAPAPGDEPPTADAEQRAMKAFVSQLERMLESSRAGAGRATAAGGREGDAAPMPLPLPEHLEDASPEDKHAYYVELLRHGEGMIELNREQMSAQDLAEAEALMAELRERLGGDGDAGTY